MATIVEAKNLADLYDLPLVEWAAVAARLDRGVTQAPGTGGPDRHTCCLATINPDGSPNVTGIGATWADGTFWFQTGARTRKARNLDRDPRCTLSLAMREFDLVVEGDAQQITDPPVVPAPAERWAVEGWPCRWTRRAGPSPPSTAHPQPDRRRGSSTASPRGRRPRSRSLNPAAPPGGAF